MMIEQIINDICEAYYNQIRKNKDGTRYRVIISPALFNKVCDYDVDLIQINENSKKYDDKLKERDFNIFLIDEIRKLYDKKFEEFLNEYLNRYSTGVKDNG